MSISLAELALMVQGRVLGLESTLISSLSPIEDIAEGSLVFVDGPENMLLAEHSNAAAILVGQTISQSSKPLLHVAHPFKAFIYLLHYFNKQAPRVPGIHPTAVIEEGVQLGANVVIGPYVVIGTGSIIGDNCTFKSHVSIGCYVQIGKDSTLHPQVTIYDHICIGSNVTIHASTVIGADGFGYTLVDGEHLKVPHIGRVVIHDNVEIGANTCIDRATLGATVVGEGTKIDNLVQVAHSVKLGKNNILCGFTGIAGSSTTGNNVIFAANVGVSDHVRIDDGVILGARTGVPPRKHLKEKEVYLGSPARLKDVAIKEDLAIKRIPLMRKNIKYLMGQIETINKRLTEV